MRTGTVAEGIRFAAVVASAPSGVVTLWKALTGGKAAACLPPSPAPEVPHAAGLLPISLESPEDLAGASGQIDVWLTGTGDKPSNMEEALDRIETLAEWSGKAAGRPVSEGAIWRSIRAYRVRRALLETLDERFRRETEFLTPEEYRDVVRAGIFLPPEAHSRLLSSILGLDEKPEVGPPEEERGDPLLVLAKRMM